MSDETGNTRFRAMIGSGAYRSLETASIVEGRNLTDEFQKIIAVYDEIWTNTSELGVSLYASVEALPRQRTKILTPGQFIHAATFVRDHDQSSLNILVTEDTKKHLQKYIEIYKEDVDRFVTQSIAYYGIVASHLYDDKKLYTFNLLRRYNPPAPLN